MVGTNWDIVGQGPTVFTVDSRCRWGCLDISSPLCQISFLSLPLWEMTHWLPRGGRVVRWCWVNFQCRGVLLIWIRVGQGPTALAMGVGRGCLDIFTLVYPFSFFLSLED